VTPAATTGEPIPSIEAPVTRHGITFGTVVDAVDDLGMDPTGHEPIDDALEEAYGDDTLLALPPGRYLVADQHEWDAGVEGFGLLGLGTGRENVELVFPPGNAGAPDPANHWFLRVSSGRDHLVENLTVQQTGDRVTGVGALFRLADGLRIVDVEFAGFDPEWSHAPGFSLLTEITDQDGVGVIRRFVSTDGGVVSEYPKRKTPIGAFSPHRGELRIKDAHVEESGSHSAYVSRTNGCVRVEGGLFRNNDNTNLRLSGGGHPNKRSWVRGSRIVVDVEGAAHLPDGERYQGARGIWVEAGGKHEYGHGDLLIEGVSAVARSNAAPFPLLLVEHSHGSVTIRNSRFASAVRGVTPVDARWTYDTVDDGGALTVESVRIDAPGRTAAGSALDVDERPGTVIRDATITLTAGSVDGLAADRTNDLRVLDSTIRARLPSQAPTAAGTIAGNNDGVAIRDSTNCLLRDLAIDVPGRATNVVNSGVELVNIHE
jgi:hypothetical protein